MFGIDISNDWLIHSYQKVLCAAPLLSSIFYFLYSLLSSKLSSVFYLLYYLLSSIFYTIFYLLSSILSSIFYFLSSVFNSPQAVNRAFVASQMNRTAIGSGLKECACGGVAVVTGAVAAAGDAGGVHAAHRHILCHPAM